MASLPRTSEQVEREFLPQFAYFCWVGVLSMALIILVVGIPIRFDERLHPSPEIRAELNELHVSPLFYAVFLHTINLIYVLVWVGTSIFIFWHKHNEPVVILYSIALMTWGVTESELLGPTQFHLVNGEFVPSHGYLLAYIGEFFQMIGWVSMLFLWFVFPNGKFVLRPSKPIAWAWAAMSVMWMLFPRVPLNQSYGDTWEKTPVLSFGVVVLVYGYGLVSQICRYRRTVNPVERQQIKWLLLGWVIVFFSPFLRYVPPMPISGSAQGELLLLPIVTLLGLAFPLSVTMAILRYRLWDIDIFINRALVYSVLTVLIAGIYVGMAIIFSRILAANVLRDQNNLLASFGATAVVLVLFQPIRERVQQVVNRVMYGERDDPYTMMDRLMEQFGQMERVSDMLPMFVQTLAQALKLPYVAVETMYSTIEFGQDNSSLPSRERVLEGFDLIFQNASVGKLIVARRQPQETLTPRDQEFLERVKTLMAVVVHDVQLVNSLKRALDRSVRASEEERKQLQRALHGGIGSSMAAQLLNLEVAISHAEGDFVGARAKLEAVAQRWREINQEIRDLAHGLRPDLSPEVAFQHALRYEVEKMQTSRIEIHLDMPEVLRDLAAAVERALLGILQNALGNLVSHSSATQCWVDIWLEADMIGLRVRDNGKGFDVDSTISQHGLREMREWAEELNGTFLIHSVLGGGTTVEARLPLLRSA